MRLRRRRNRLQQLEVELLLELATELRALRPPDFGLDMAAGGEVELDLGADRQLLAAFDQRAAARDVAQARALHLPLVVEQRSADDADSRLARRQLLGKRRRALGGEVAGILGRHRHAEDISLD